MKVVKIKKQDEQKDFAIQAAKMFAKDPKLTTYTNGEIEAGCFFAMRYGLDRNGVVIFKLDKEFEPINFHDLINYVETQ